MRYLYSILSLFLLLSCSTEFSKYEKRGENDCERLSLKGNVKKVVTYGDNGNISEIEKFNKWGYYVERIDYNTNNEIEELEKYSYNEYGNLIKKEETSSDGHRIIYTYQYNSKNHVQNIWEESFTQDSSVGTKSLVNSYEYEYDDQGHIYKRIIRSENSTQYGNFYIEILNIRGDILEVYHIDSNGKPTLLRKYSYNGKDRTSYDGFYSDGTTQIHCDYFYINRNKEDICFQQDTKYPSSPQYNYITIFHYDNVDNDVTMIEDIYKDYTTKFYIKEEYDNHKNWLRREKLFMKLVNGEKNQKDNNLEYDNRKITYYE